MKNRSHWRETKPYPLAIARELAHHKYWVAHYAPIQVPLGSQWTRRCPFQPLLVLWLEMLVYDLQFSWQEILYLSHHIGVMLLGPRSSTGSGSGSGSGNGHAEPFQSIQYLFYTQNDNWVNAEELENWYKDLIHLIHLLSEVVPNYYLDTPGGRLVFLGALMVCDKRLADRSRTLVTHLYRYCDMQRLHAWMSEQSVLNNVAFTDTYNAVTETTKSDKSRLKPLHAIVFLPAWRQRAGPVPLSQNMSMVLNGRWREKITTQLLLDLPELLHFFNWCRLHPGFGIMPESIRRETCNEP